MQETVDEIVAAGAGSPDYEVTAQQENSLVIGEVLLLIIVKELLGIDDENNAAGVGAVGFIQTAAGREGPAFCPFVPQGAADVEVVTVDSFVYDEMVGVKVGECVTATGIFAADEPVFCIGYIDPVREYPLICLIFQEFIGMKLTCFIAFLYVCGKFVSKTDVALGVFRIPRPVPSSRCRYAPERSRGRYKDCRPAVTRQLLPAQGRK